jgi:hypothetical protein
MHTDTPAYGLWSLVQVPIEKGRKNWQCGDGLVLILA